MIDRRTWSAAMLGALVVPASLRAQDHDGAGSSVLRVPFEAAETGFDPARIGDLYSARVTAHIFESPYRYDLLAMPVKVRLLTAAAMPEVSDDFRVWTIRLQPGIFFADDPAFKGRQRELVAQDYVYAIQRYFDPATRSPGYSGLEEEGIEGLDELRQAALRSRTAFDYDAPVPGLRALDRYTLQFRLRAPRPRFDAKLCDSSSLGAVAREVVEFYGDAIPAHPVGTGPYRLKQWRRSSRIVLERNPDFREMLYDGEPAADDAQGQAWLERFKGRRLPLNDGVEISVLEEGQSRWLSFLNGQVDCERVPSEFTHLAAPGGVLAPNLAKRGITMRRYVNSDFTMSWWNMDDPVVGGYTPAKVALRRAIGLAYNIGHEIRIVRRGSAIAAQAPMPPGTYGYDPGYRSENSSHDPARAKALLDIFGYRDRDGDGWREQPDGSPLVLQMATQSSQVERQFDENWQKSLAAVGLRIRFNTAQWPENMKAARAGTLQMWSLGSTATTPDGLGPLGYMYGPSIGSDNLARFKLPAFDALYDRMLALPDGPERAGLFHRASELVLAYMPYKIHAHRVYTDLSQPWITGWRQARFRNEAWQFVEVDTAMRDRMTR
ncbi:MAG: ABC transporter substrate-binding protein [Burkholderiaceae bacterium]